MYLVVDILFQNIVLDLVLPSNSSKNLLDETSALIILQ